MIVILMGVAGSGKTTVGRLLAEELGWGFYDGDDYHPADNIAKMAAGIPLTDADRRPWLARLRDLIHTLIKEGASAVMACSALKAPYRDLLAQHNPGVRFVYLRASPGLIRNRLERRADHFMPANMVDSQFEALEEPEGALVVDAALPVEEAVHIIKMAFSV